MASPTEYFNNGTDMAWKVVGVAGGTPVPVSGSVSPATPMSEASMQGATILNAKSTSGSGATQAPTFAGAANQRVTVRKIIIFASAAGNATLTITDGTWTMDLGTLAVPVSTAAALIIDLGPLTGNTGATITVNVGAIAVQTTTISVIADRS